VDGQPPLNRKLPARRPPRSKGEGKDEGGRQERCQQNGAVVGKIHPGVCNRGEDFMQWDAGTRRGGEGE